jgi:hypothetical protein
MFFSDGIMKTTVPQTNPTTHKIIAYQIATASLFDLTGTGISSSSQLAMLCS